mmetsp:Transcript_75044/g.208662  ORF Transcript_75044/g.208662 Transcript_75044/m.208662 type:complete len:213 (-) Transcript_75044:8-646(-)
MDCFVPLPARTNASATRRLALPKCLSNARHSDIWSGRRFTGFMKCPEDTKKSASARPSKRCLRALGAASPGASAVSSKGSKSSSLIGVKLTGHSSPGGSFRHHAVAFGKRSTRRPIAGAGSGVSTATSPALDAHQVPALQTPPSWRHLQPSREHLPHFTKPVHKSQSSSSAPTISRVQRLTFLRSTICSAPTNVTKALWPKRPEWNCKNGKP